MRACSTRAVAFSDRLAVEFHFFKSDVFDVLNVFILSFLHRGNYFYVMLFSDLLVVSVSVTKKSETPTSGSYNNRFNVIY